MPFNPVKCGTSNVQPHVTPEDIAALPKYAEIAEQRAGRIRRMTSQSTEHAGHWCKRSIPRESEKFGSQARARHGSRYCDPDCDTHAWVEQMKNIGRNPLGRLKKSGFMARSLNEDSLTKEEHLEWPCDPIQAKEGRRHVSQRFNSLIVPNIINVTVQATGVAQSVKVLVCRSEVALGSGANEKSHLEELEVVGLMIEERSTISSFLV
ncbi:hypothetical protein ANN_08174 [Periplaneta americana]|uniref:Uncharacterized protein n=1 Tax=Periplaneta americana TaxID=6978 RepID=A0ABQ8T227_PERAM|nr:hypothetical protein ANN_08174 [Periplaneta americana]